MTRAREGERLHALRDREDAERQALGKLATCARCNLAASALNIVDGRCANTHACARRRRQANKRAQRERVVEKKREMDARFADRRRHG